MQRKHLARTRKRLMSCQELSASLPSLSLPLLASLSDDSGFRSSSAFAEEGDGETLPPWTWMLSAHNSSPTSLVLRAVPRFVTLITVIYQICRTVFFWLVLRSQQGDKDASRPSERNAHRHVHTRSERGGCVRRACALWRSIKQVSGCVSICSREGSDSPII